MTSIGKAAFSDCNSLESIAIPNSVTSIGAGAFCKCGSLKNIAIPDSVTSIGDSAFKGCSILTNINIPDSVTSIGDSAFEGCNSLTSVTIPDSVTSIGNSAFYGCKNLKDVTIPKSVTDIGKHAFKETKWLSEYPDDFVILKSGFLIEYKGKENILSIPDSVTSIGGHAFYEYKNLTSVTIPDSVTSIGDGAFAYCSNLTSIVIPDSVTSIGDGAFYKCDNITSVTIPDSVTSIGNSAFEGCYNLTSVTIPDSVISIGWGAFEGCNLSSFTIPKTVREVGKGSFRGCKEITVYDSIDPDAKPCKSHLDACNGEPNSLLGAIVNYSLISDWLDYEITVRSAKTNEIKYKVWMGADRTQRSYCCTLLSSWGRNATFNFNAVDEMFPKIKGTHHKIKVALNRLRYPVDLTDEQKEMYRSYIVRSAKNAVKLCIDTDDMEMMLDLEQLGVIKKNNINELLAYATEKKAVQFTAYLLEYKESHFNKGKNVLDSLKL